MSSSRSTRSVTVPSDSGRAGAVRRDHPEVAPAGPARAAPARSSYAAAGSTSRSTETPAAPAPVSSATGTSAAQQCATGVAPASVTAANTHSSAGLAPRRRRPSGAGGSPDAVGTRPASTAGSAGSSTCTTRSAPGIRRRTSATWSRSPSASACGQLAAGAVVGEHPVAAGPLDGGGQRPRAGDLDLERAGVALGVLLDGVEVLGQQRPRPAVVDAGRVGQPPAGRLQVGAELGDHARARGRSCRRARRGRAARAGAAGRAARRARPGRRRSKSVASSPGIDPTPVARGHAVDARCATVEAIVQEPTTRVPSYTTAAWPGAMPCAGSSSSTTTSSPVDRDDGAVLVAVRPQLDGAVQRLGRGGAAPARPDALDAVDGQLLAGPDGHGAGDRLDVEHVARLAVVGGTADAAGPCAGRS